MVAADMLTVQAGLKQDVEDFLRVEWHDPALRVTTIKPVPEGHSGFTYKVEVLSQGDITTYILRLPPPGTRAVGSADVIRHARIVIALHRAGLPVPRIAAMTERPAIAGRPMIMMEIVDGARIELVARRHDPAAIAQSAVSVLRLFHSLEINRTGIAEAPTPLNAEIDRWNNLCSRAPDEVPASAETLFRRLRSSKPGERSPTLVHGDYHYGNLLFNGSAIRAVIDWEIATVGQPLIDLASIYVTITSGNKLIASGLPNLGIPLEQLASMYGADPMECRWYVALGCYKYASVVAYNLSLHKRGRRLDSHYESLAGSIEQMITHGLDVLGPYEGDRR